MKRINLIAGLLFLTGTTSFAQQTVTQPMSQLIDEQFNFAAEQYKVLDQGIPPD